MGQGLMDLLSVLGEIISTFHVGLTEIMYRTQRMNEQIETIHPFSWYRVSIFLPDTSRFRQNNHHPMKSSSHTLGTNIHRTTKYNRQSFIFLVTSPPWLRQFSWPPILAWYITNWQNCNPLPSSKRSRTRFSLPSWGEMEGLEVCCLNLFIVHYFWV